MIPYVEIIDKYTLKKYALIEPQECWFELSYQNYGEFEIYCRASQANLQALKKGQFVKIPNKRFIWFITSVKYSFTADGSRMISAKGYEAKWLLNKRCIQAPKELQGTITSAIYSLVDANMGTAASSERQIKGFVVDSNEILIDISGSQATRGNLGDFANNLLITYNCGSQVIYEAETLKYTIFTGKVRNGVKFSQSLDNLLSSEYITDDSNIATHALTVSTVEDVDYTQVYDTGAAGIDRAEIVVNSNLSTKYENANGVEQETTPTSELYKGWQIEEAKNALAEHVAIDDISGEIDLQNSLYEFDKHFFVGDIVSLQDEYFNFKLSTRISKYTMRQDANGYAEGADYGN